MGSAASFGCSAARSAQPAPRLFGEHPSTGAASFLLTNLPRRNLLHSCHISVGLCYTLLNAMQCGDITLEVAHRHVGTLSEAGVRLTAAFTALGSLIRPPKQKQRRFARLRMLARRRAAAKAAGGEDEAEPLPASNATAGAAGAALPGSALARPPSRTRDVEGAAEAHVCADRAADVDDPFAELDGSGGQWVMCSVSLHALLKLRDGAPGSAALPLGRAAAVHPTSCTLPATHRRPVHRLPTLLQRRQTTSRCRWWRCLRARSCVPSRWPATYRASCSGTRLWAAMQIGTRQMEG